MIRLTPPTPSGAVSSGWGDSRAYRGGWHAGLDFPAPVGTPMLAAAGGVVSYIDNTDNSNAGKFLVIDHGDGVFTRYLHAHRISVRVGQRVSRGERIGEVGRTGIKSSAPHVHFDVKMGPAALAAYKAEFGEPTTGFSASMGAWGRGVPAEAIMDGATYRPAVIARGATRNVKFYKSSPLVPVAIAGVFGLVLYWWLVR